MNFRPLAAAAVILAACTAAQAGTPVFSDNFDSNARGLNLTPAGWTLSDGWVDIIGEGLYDFLSGNGSYIDMDGTNMDAGKISQSVTLAGGVPHTLSFDLAGNRRDGASTERVDVVFGSTSASYSLAALDGFTTYTLAFTPSATGSYTVSFEGAGGDNVGMLLDRVSVTAVPEPQTYALLALGLVAVAAKARRRRGN